MEGIDDIRGYHIQQTKSYACAKHEMQAILISKSFFLSIFRFTFFSATISLPVIFIIAIMTLRVR